jgi:hypothetical protein
MREIEMQLDAWTVDRIAYLKSLKSLSEQQSLLVLLSEKNDEPKNDKKLSALIKFEKANVRASKARQIVNNLLHAEEKSSKEAERKARNHRLIQQGLLIDFAGLDGWNHGELLGGLISMAKSESIPLEKRADWKRLGDALISSKEKKL